MGYDNQYRAAALAIGGDEVINTMLARLDDPVWEHDAAILLGQLLEVDPVERGPMGPKWTTWPHAMRACASAVPTRRTLLPHD